MSNPFDDLPALKRAPAPTKREREEEEEAAAKKEEGAEAEAPPPPPSAADARPPSPPRPPSPNKKARREEDDDQEDRGEAAAKKQDDEEQAPPATAAPPPSADADAVAAALARLTAHVRSSARIVKAGPLLRQLLDPGPNAAFDPARHSAAAFAAVAAAFSDPSQFLSAPPAARLEYARLARSAQRVAWRAPGGESEQDAASAKLYCGECAAAWALLRHEMLSAEDGFALSRALGKLKNLVDALPAWEEGDEAEEDEEEKEEDDGAKEKAASTTKTTTPPTPTPKPPPPISWPPPPSRVLLLRRRAALDCALCARDHCHGRAAWAATAVEIALEHVASRGDRFAPGSQRAQAKSLLDFVSSARAARRAGAGGGAAAGGQGKDDRGAFERARAQFAAAGNVSARGSVGMRGGGSAPWLG